MSPFHHEKDRPWDSGRALRYQIDALLKARLLQKDIAKQIGISSGALSKELNNNGGRDGYDPEKADRRAEKLQREAHVHYRYSEDVWEEVEDAIREDLSPEQVAGRRRLEGKETPSVPAIYRRILGRTELRPHLRHRGKPYRKRGPAKDRRGSISDQRWIDERPAAVDRKERFGDFEIDRINGARTRT